MERRLAAILAADVVGYSRLMADDELGTLAALKAQRHEIIEPRLHAHTGRIVKLMGDGLLLEFASAVNAVSFAIELQNEIAAGNSNVPQERRLVYRIGINIGDIVVEGGDIYGDGVNIASRLERLAEPGGVWIAHSVYDQVRAKLDLEFEDQGEQRLKNIPGLMRVYRVRLNGARTTPHNNVITDHLIPRLPDAPSIAVLPFTNISGDLHQEYLADGITEDIISALAAWRSFPVIARSSTFTYKNQDMDTRVIARDLGVRYLLQGSLRVADKQLRISTQLVEGATGRHISAQKYDRHLDDVFRIQDEIAQRIAAIVEPQIERAELKRSVRQKPTNLDSLDHYYRGMAKLYSFTQQGIAEARDIFSQAINLDPMYSQPFVGIAYSHQVDILMGYTKYREASINSLFDAARSAIALDESDSMAHVMLGFACRWARQHDLAITEAERAIELNPSNSFAYILLGNVLDLSGQPDEGIAAIEKGRQLNPLDPRMHLTLAVLARIHLNARRYEEAARYARQSINHRPDHPGAYAILAVASNYLGNAQDARNAVADCERVRPGYITVWANQERYRNPDDNQHFVVGLKNAGMPT